MQTFEWIRIEWIRTGGIRAERIRIGGICIGGIRLRFLLMHTFWMDTHWMDTHRMDTSWWDTCWTDTYWWDTYWWDTFWMDMCAKSADANLLNGYALNGYVLLGYVLNGYVLVGYVLVGYVWNGYVWDMCGVRYANNLLKNPATKRLSGSTVPTKQWKNHQKSKQTKTKRHGSVEILDNISFFCHRFVSLFFLGGDPSTKKPSNVPMSPSPPQPPSWAQGTIALGRSRKAKIISIGAASVRWKWKLSKILGPAPETSVFRRNWLLLSIGFFFFSKSLLIGNDGCWTISIRLKLVGFMVPGGINGCFNW